VVGTGRRRADQVPQVSDEVVERRGVEVLVDPLLVLRPDGLGHVLALEASEVLHAALRRCDVVVEVPLGLIEELIHAPLLTEGWQQHRRILHALDVSEEGAGVAGEDPGGATLGGQLDPGGPPWRGEDSVLLGAQLGQFVGVHGGNDPSLAYGMSAVTASWRGLGGASRPAGGGRRGSRPIHPSRSARELDGKAHAPGRPAATPLSPRRRGPTPAGRHRQSPSAPGTAAPPDGSRRWLRHGDRLAVVPSATCRRGLTLLVCRWCLPHPVPRARRRLGPGRRGGR
jgi:hypothetical protein